MTDSRTNEPTEAQVEAAVHAAWVKSREFRGVGGQAEFAPPWEFQQIIRAALVAAQGAAPVLPSSGVDEDKLAVVERVAAEKAWDRCVGEMPIDPDWKNFYGDNNPYRKGQDDER